MTQMSAATRIFARELRGGFRGFRVFVACLALGVASVAAIGTVKSSVETGLATEGASILGGDAEIEFSYRFADDEELEWMQRVSERVSTVVDFRSMATTTRNGDPVRSLTQVKAIDGNYPLYGEVVLDSPGQVMDALAPAGGVPGALMQRSLANRLQIEPGDTFALGTQEFRLAAFVEQEPDAIASGPCPDQRRSYLPATSQIPASLAPVHCSHPSTGWHWMNPLTWNCLGTKQGHSFPTEVYSGATSVTAIRAFAGSLNGSGLSWCLSGWPESPSAASAWRQPSECSLNKRLKPSPP